MSCDTPDSNINCLIPICEDQGLELNKRVFGTGSVRDRRDGKGRYDLIPQDAWKLLAIHFENGCKKYGERNWELGQPLASYYDSATRHLNDWFAGVESEDDNLTAALWNVCVALATRERIKNGKLPEELDDRPK